MPADPVRWTGRLVAVVMIASAAACSTSTSGPDPRPTGPAPTADQGCTDVVFLGVRGSTQSPTANRGVGKEVLPTTRALTERLKKRSTLTTRLEPVPYPARRAATLAIYQADVADGVERLGRHIERLRRDCPATDIGLIGFSQGAQVVHEFAEGLLPADSERLVVVAMIADPLRNPDDDIATWSYGTTTAGRGKLGAGARIGAGVRDVAITFCTADDDVCNSVAGSAPGSTSAAHRLFYEQPATARITAERIDQVLLGRR